MVNVENYFNSMKKIKKIVEARTADATPKKGLLMVYTGNGKGKTTAALGMLFRFISHGMRCAVVQFIKSKPDSTANLIHSPLLTWDCFGDGFLLDTQDWQRDVECARLGWNLALERMADPQLEFLLLDELNILLTKGYLSEIEILNGLHKRKMGLHVVITGRGAPFSLVTAADLVTEMKEIKHQFKAGILAQRGIEF